jgi:hypothetical protein
MELPVHIDLALSDVASKIRDGMGDVVVRHRQNGNLDRNILSMKKTIIGSELSEILSVVSKNKLNLKQSLG